MNMDAMNAADAERRLDGNAAAGALRELFTVDLTTAAATCEGCGRIGVVAELNLYGGGLGFVLRCPTCDTAMIRLARTPAGLHLDMRGIALLRIAAAAGG
jgi:hypothetical protein